MRLTKHKGPFERLLLRSTYNHVFFGYVHGYVMGAAERTGYEKKKGEPGGPYGAIKEAIVSFCALNGEKCTDTYIESAAVAYRSLRREFESVKTDLYNEQQNNCNACGCNKAI